MIIVGKSGSSHLRKIQKLQRIFELEQIFIYDEHIYTLAWIFSKPSYMPVKIDFRNDYSQSKTF